MMAGHEMAIGYETRSPEQQAIDRRQRRAVVLVCAGYARRHRLSRDAFLALMAELDLERDLMDLRDGRGHTG